jgi:surface polysaccharide O-acyltransferase-like enzyme
MEELLMEKDTVAETKKYNATLDIAKLFFAILVVAIHTEPFGFSFLLDKGFGIITRLCVPFFFVTSSYLFFKKNGRPFKYVKRIFALYSIWCLLYLFINFAQIKGMTLPKLIVHYFWEGHDVLWYLMASIIGFLITYTLSRKMSPTPILIIGILFLAVGCIQSTYVPLFRRLFSVDIPEIFGSRNGVVYAFPYYALGLFIAKQNSADISKKYSKYVGFAACLCLLVVESAIFVVIFKTTTNILWLSVFPLTYYLLKILNDVNIYLPYNCSLIIRKTSIFVYVIHPFFLRAFNNFRYLAYFFIVASASVLVSLLVVWLSSKRFFKWLQILL